MNAVGIIAEFNPFHSGHEFLLNQARQIAKDRPIVVVMSGNYVQRGEMAIMDKWSRAQAALASGADLVVEMPFSVSVQPADQFARGALKILADLGVTDLVFGVEDANLNFAYLGEKIAQIPQNKLDFRDYSQTYSTQYNHMVAREIGYEVNQPNLILALAYAVANYELDQVVKLHPVKRIGADHNDLLDREKIVQSATAIRNALIHQENLDLIYDWLPKQEAEQLLAQNIYPNWNLLFPFLKYRLESASIKQLQEIYQMSEGLEYKMKQEIHLARDFTDFLRKVKSKRYTYTRLRRLSLYTLLNVSQQDIAQAQTDMCVTNLGYSKLGRRYLKEMRKKFALDLISKMDKSSSLRGSAKLQIRTDRLFEQLSGQAQNFGKQPLEVK